MKVYMGIDIESRTSRYIFIRNTFHRSDERVYASMEGNEETECNSQLRGKVATLMSSVSGIDRLVTCRKCTLLQGKALVQLATRQKYQMQHTVILHRQ